MRWQALKIKNLETLSKMGDRLHTLAEPLEAFREKAEEGSGFCFELHDDRDALTGYAIALPFAEGEVPPLQGSMEDAIVEAIGRPMVLYLHDVAIEPRARGAAGFAYWKMIRELATKKGIKRLACVAVYGHAHTFARLGWQVSQPRDPSALAAYGPDAQYMTYTLR